MLHETERRGKIKADVVWLSGLRQVGGKKPVDTGTGEGRT